MDFPHMNDSSFPHLNTVDVFKYQNNFDYSRWTGKISIKLMNVLWNSNYADVPAFDSDEERDTWFDNQPGMVKTLESAFNITPENSVRIPIPYNDAYRFNYLVVDMPMQTSVSEPLDFENENTRVKRWYYFIDSMTQTAPNTTEIYLTLDVWTTFVNTVEIPYLMLERGHAPMFQTTVESYLANPIENSEYLLADDFNYGNVRNVSESSYIPIGNGRKYVLFAVPIQRVNLTDVGGVSQNGSETLPTFSNTDERWGYQIQVNGYEWNYGNGDYSNANMPIIPMLNQDSVFNGNVVYAIASENAQAFFNNLANSAVHFLHAIQAVFVVSEDMINLGDFFDFRGYRIAQVSKQYTTFDISLNKAAFNFDSKYSEIAKLYTYPYSVLEITDDNGFSTEVRIENTGNVQFHKEISIAFPFVRYQLFFTGFNGNGKINYTWRNLSNQNVAKEIWEDDFSKFMMNWDIPTYAVFATQEQEFAVTNYAGMQARRQGAIVDYENAVRFGNTTRENTDDETDAMIANVAVQNAANTAITAQNVATSKANTQRNNEASAANGEANIAKLAADHVTDSTLSASLTGLQNDVASATTAMNNGCSMATSGISAATGIIGGAVSGGVPGAASGAISGVGNLLSTGVRADTATATTGIMIGANITTVLNITGANTNKFAHARTNIRAIYTETNNANTTTTNNACDAMTNNTATNNASNANQTANTCDTIDANATYTRNANVVASQNTLIQRQREAAAQYANNRLGNLVRETDYSGDAYPDVFERRGVRVNLRTQTKSAIAQAGDAMLRYGYALHRNWDMSNGFHYGKHFTFWKAEDIWINEGNGLAGNAVNAIGDILLKGVTVWKNPDEIGKVSIYENV